MAKDLGKIHVYTGDDKGKTTAALGLALRAIGAGYQVYIVQFMKGQDYSELTSLKKIKEITLKRFGQKSFVHGRGTKKDKELAQKGMAWARRVLKSRRFDVIILDEVLVAVFFKLISEQDLFSVVKNKPKNVELILTGRRATPKIKALADYVTEMREIKHPFKTGLMARRGIEH